MKLSAGTRAGFAEANPSADILGHDAAQKITLLSSLLFRKEIDLTSVQTEGIAHIQPQDLRISSALNYVLRPIVFSKKLPDGSILSGVRNTLLAKTHTLATIRDSLNAVLIQSKYAKNTLIVGEGAGSYPTASAILSDLIFLHKMQNLSIQNPFAESAPFTESSSFAESFLIYRVFLICKRFDSYKKTRDQQPCRTIFSKQSNAFLYAPHVQQQESTRPLRFQKKSEKNSGRKHTKSP